MGGSAVPGRSRGDWLRAAAAVGLVGAVFLTGMAGTGAGAVPAVVGTGRPASPCTDRVLAAPARGEAAVRALGAVVASVAAQNHTTGRELVEALREDRTLWLDECGALFFQDEAPAGLVQSPAQAPALAPAQAEAATWPVTVAPAEAFTLHSRPGSSRVLLLDFDGHLVVDTAWNSTSSSWTAPPFSTDADPLTFSDSERNVVVEVWRRVAQDYAPFDVDVTTQDPGQAAITRSSATDLLFGTRVLISPDARQAVCGCGGQAYVGVFDNPYSHDYYQPAWVYPQALANNAKYIADAASHEAGHNFGLSHDGTQTASYYSGSGGWGPIMGAPYGQAITQWSNGSYSGANNAEDDLSLIAANGAPRMADDVTTAVPLPLPGSATGLVNGTSDVDDFTMSAPTGTLTVSAAPHWPGPNLDVAVTLRDAAGVIVATAAPAFNASTVQASIGASLVVPLSSGTYTVSVEGSGNGLAGSAGESDYGSVGWYTLTVSTTGSETPSPTPTPSSTPTPTPTPSSTPTPTPTATPTQSASPTPTPTPTPSVSPPITGPSATPPVVSPPLPTAIPPTAAVAALGVQTSTLPTATRKRPYRAHLVASGGSGSYTWRRSKGSLPKGLTLSRSGSVTGKAKSRGATRVRVMVTDSTGATSLRWVRIRVR